MSDKPKAGPTGDYSLGAPIHQHDRGGLNVSVGIVNGYIMMDFGTTLDWLASPPEYTVPMAKKLGQLAIVASLAAGKPINFHDLDFAMYADVDHDESRRLAGGLEVTINREKGVIETKLPCNVGMVAFDPQGAFAYALRLMICVKALRPDLATELPDLPKW